MNKPELLAPAGDLTTLKTAARFGADAVYVGGPLLQLRAARAAFDEEALAAGAAYLHARGKKLYVAVNSFAHDAEIDALGPYARRLRALGADAAIVSDLGAIAAMRESCPELDIHVSTQANCLNYRTASVYASMGATRVVAARELSLEGIAALHDRLPGLEIEAFAHGAMCMAYSGRCLLSSFLAGGRSGNRGDCAQPCRWQYHLVEHKRPGEFFALETSESGLAILSSGDLCCLPFLDRMAQAGISSLKIEGRMKTAYYVGTVVNAYRMRLDGAAPLDALEREVCAVSHRPYVPGFYLGPPAQPEPDDGAYLHDCTYVAAVLGRQSGGEAVVEQRNLFSVGDRVEVVRPGRLGESFAVTALRTSEGEPRTRANHPKEVLVVNCPLDLEPGDMLRVRDAKR